MGEMTCTAGEQFPLVLSAGAFPSRRPYRRLGQGAIDAQAVIILVAVVAAFGWVAYTSVRERREPQQGTSTKTLWKRLLGLQRRKSNGKRRPLSGKSRRSGRL